MIGMSKNITDKQHLEGIGGWLLLVAIGIVLTPFLLLAEVTTYIPLLNDLDEFDDMFSLFLIIELVINSILSLLSLYLAYLFFRKSYKTPNTFIIFNLLSLFVIIIDLVVAVQFFELSIDSGDTKELVKQLIRCLIWIPYFLVSVRVKNTFVQGRKQTKPQYEDATIVS